MKSQEISPTECKRGRKARNKRWSKNLLRAGQTGQALVLVLGVITMISLGAVALAQNVSQHYPLVEQDVLEHEAYRAMTAGVNEYLSKVNQNADYVACSPAVVETGYPGHWSSPVSTGLASSLCTGLSYLSWTSVPNVASTKGPPAWFLFGTPTIYDCTGTDSGNSAQCPSPSAWISMQVVGAAGYSGSMSYNTGTVTFQPTNDFLLNLFWLNYDQEDPSILAGSGSTCNYYYDYPTTPASQDYLNSPCEPVDLITGETLSGNIFSNDVIFICGSPTINGTVSSADPNAATTTDPRNVGYCGTPSIKGSYTASPGQSQEPIPTDDDVLQNVAADQGCLYEGPTEILLAQNQSVSPSTWEMQVTSPDTPTSSSVNDGDNHPGNPNTCIPSTSGGWVKYPSDGVVFVENCQSSNTTCSASSAFNPLSGVYPTNDPQQVDSYGPTDGDAFVEGTEQGPLTIAAQDDVVVTGNLCYQSWNSGSLASMSTSAGTAYFSTSCGTAPSTPTSDVLGLVAYNYIELNYPNNSGTPNCTNNMAPYGLTASLNCDLCPNNCNATGTTYIDAALLALNQQFWVAEYNTGGSQGYLELNGTIGEDWRGPVGEGNNGYVKDYVYDQRLAYLSPPDYLNPGTNSWQIGSISTSRASCPSTLCSSVP